MESQEPQVEPQEPQNEGPEQDPMPVLRQAQEPQIEEPHKNPIGIILAAILGLFGAATGFILGKKRKGK